MNTIQDLERLVAAIEKQGANVAPTYQEYIYKFMIMVKYIYNHELRIFLRSDSNHQ